MSKVFERGSLEPRNVTSDLENISDWGSWSCAPMTVLDPIEEDGLFWVNYYCDTAGSHSFGPYKEYVNALLISRALKEIPCLKKKILREASTSR